MYRNILISFLLLALTNYLLGCYSSQKVKKEEVFQSNKMITEVVLHNADVIVFDESGGNYHSISSSLIGNLIPDGRYKILSIESISEFRAEITPSVHPEEIGNEVITEVVDVNNRLYKFNDKGGRYDSDRKVIIGFGLNNDLSSFLINNIREIHTEKPKLIPREDVINTPDLFVAQVLLSYF